MARVGGGQVPAAARSGDCGGRLSEGNSTEDVPEQAGTQTYNRSSISLSMSVSGRGP